MVYNFSRGADNPGYIKNLECVAYSDADGASFFQSQLYKRDGKYYLYGTLGPGFGIIDVTDPENPVFQRRVVAIDREKFKENIKKATSFIRSLQSAEGGLAYNKNEERGVSPDTNSWVSMFAAQALLWQIEEPDKEWIG